MRNFLTMVMMLFSFSLVFASGMEVMDNFEQPEKQKTELQNGVEFAVNQATILEVSIESKAETVENPNTEIFMSGFEDYGIVVNTAYIYYTNLKEDTQINKQPRFPIQNGNNYLSCLSR